MKKLCLVLLLLAALLACGGKTPRTAPGQIQPGSAEYLTNEGIGHLNSGRLDLAERSLSEALKKDPRLVPAMNALALVYVYRREFPKAVPLLERLLRLQPAFHDAHNLLGTIYTEQGRYELAKENLLIAANAQEYQTPENSFANLAVLEIKFEKYESALRYAEKGLMLNRHFAPLYNLKGLALENLNRIEEAAENYDRALALLTTPDPAYLVNSARVAARLGDRKKALDQLELAISRVQDDAQKAEILKLIKDLGEK
ncbi:MAG: tetratricopeptide repeat protein [Candidatus Aminicenantes bacterium]|nr:tetratricopeptide repeat protein [Candidatus Aminicenantes bacterium]